MHWECQREHTGPWARIVGSIPTIAMLINKMKYEQHFAERNGWSKWIFPARKGYRQACCDCGLVHVYEFRLRGRHIEYRVKRHNRATAGQRRGKDHKL